MNRKLTKSEARELLAPVVDNEVSAEERDAFLAYIAHDKELKQEYESMKRIKALMGNRCPCAKAPDSLKHFLSTYCSSDTSASNTPPIYDIPSKKSVSQQDQLNTSTQHSKWWYYAAAAIVVFTVSVWGFLNYQSSMVENSTYNIEKYAYQHFMKHDGKLVPPTISTASLGIAEIELAQHYDMSMTIPELDNADFKGVVYEEFVPNFKTPMLEYHLSGEDQYIYIFTFNIDKMEQFGQLVRDQDAVKACTKSGDFHIRDVNGKHVVSWKWNNIWYAAISNHDGNTLASLVKPLEYEPSED
ncbi:anti-sigma factor family protein [Fodinibius sp. AD559]|uniref:anti-sigma factor family protein n=1 Tax=Fodinibius sp. AD559 TaxID=3424179 RepID=UPI004046C78B